MSSREEFEAWLSIEYPWGNEALDKAFFSGNDDNGYYTGGDFIYDGSSCADALFWAWRGWQESHKQAEDKCAALAADNRAITQYFDTIALDTAKMIMCDVGRRHEFCGGDLQLLSRIQCRIDEACRAAMLQEISNEQ